MVLVALVLLLIGVIIFRLTGGIGRRGEEAAAFDTDRVAAEAAEITEEERNLIAYKNAERLVLKPRGIDIQTSGLSENVTI